MKMSKRRRSAAAKKAWEARKQPGWEPLRVKVAQFDRLELMRERAVAEGNRLRRAAIFLHFRRPGFLPL